MAGQGIQRRIAWMMAIGLLSSSTAACGQLPDFGKFDGIGGRLGGRGKEVTLSAQFTPATADRPALLFVTAKIADGFHVYAVDQGKLPDGGGPLATKITLAANSPARVVGPFQPLEPPTVHIDEQGWIGLELREHVGEVTWVAVIDLAPGVAADSAVIEGTFDGMACSNVCVPLTLKFTAQRGNGLPLPASFSIAAGPVAQPADSTPAQFAATRGFAPDAPERLEPLTNPSEGTQANSAPPSTASSSAYDISQIRLEQVADHSLWYYLLTALAGGVILNVMPCVLPVIGLKVMSFVQQAGESRSRALVLNLWYSAGIVSVFLALAGLAVSLKVGWGDQFGNSTFVIVLTGVVFAMALSLMGLWEIPLPGFVGSGAALKAAEREGAPAAFFKGVLTTVLATPCTGPYMVAGTAWAIKQPPHVTFAVFTALGLGMASPYLLAGAFPQLVHFLPKPGMWMETFKKAMGLVLLATVVWLLSALDPALVVPTFALMVGITAACWWVAQTPATEPVPQQLYAWATAAMFIGIVAIGSYQGLYKQVMGPRYERRVADAAQRGIDVERLQIASELSRASSPEEVARIARRLATEADGETDKPWQSFSLPRLGKLTLGDRRTVLVDFTADWCPTCKVLEQAVLKTSDVEKALAAANVATMTADYTQKPDWMSETIQALGGIGVPVVAIFPADRPYHPIVFPSGYTKSALLEAIAAASRGPAVTASLLPGASER